MYNILQRQTESMVNECAHYNTEEVFMGKQDNMLTSMCRTPYIQSPAPIPSPQATSRIYMFGALMSNPDIHGSATYNVSMSMKPSKGRWWRQLPQKMPKICLPAV